MFRFPYFVLFATLGLLSFGACAPRLSDEFIETQVREEMTKISVPTGFGRPIEFNKYFSLDDVSIIDKKSEKDRCVAICSLTFTVKQSYAADSIVNNVFVRLVVNGSGRQGEVKKANMNFVFELYDNGWRLIDVRQ